MDSARVSVMKMVAQWRTASPTNYGAVFGVFVPVNAPDRQTQDRRRGGLRGGFGTATDRGECRSKSSLRQACRELRALRHSSRRHMLGFGGYGSGWRTRPARAFVASP